MLVSQINPDLIVIDLKVKILKKLRRERQNEKPLKKQKHFKEVRYPALLSIEK